MIIELKANVMDAALEYVRDNTENIYVCNNYPTTFIEASSTYRLGVKESPFFTGPIAGEGSTRLLTVDAISDGVINNNGLASYIALTDDSESEVLAILVLDEPKLIDGELTFTMTSFPILMNLIQE